MVALGGLMNILQRINEVRKKVTYIQKDASVQSYQAVTHDMVTAKLRDALIAQGIVIVPSLTDSSTHDVESRSGSKMIRYEAEFLISFCNIQDPADKIEMTVPAHAMDNGDKAPGKALSYAIKYAMLKVFTLETGENDESRVEHERQIETIDQAQADQIRELTKQYGKTEDELISSVIKPMLKVDKIEQLNARGFEWLKQLLEKKIHGTTNS